MKKEDFYKKYNPRMYDGVCMAVFHIPIRLVSPEDLLDRMDIIKFAAITDLDQLLYDYTHLEDE